MSLYGSKEYYEEQLAEAQLEKKVYLSALKEEVNAEQPDMKTIDKLVAKINSAINTITRSKEELKEIAKREEE